MGKIASFNAKHPGSAYGERGRGWLTLFNHDKCKVFPESEQKNFGRLLISGGVEIPHSVTMWLSLRAR